MLSHLLKENAGSVIVSTGNVLNVSDLRKKAGQKPTDEVRVPATTPRKNRSLLLCEGSE